MTKLPEYMRSKVRKGNPFLSEPKVVADLYFQRTDVKRRVRVCVCVCVCVLTIIHGLVLYPEFGICFKLILFLPRTEGGL